jgi:hypothetical protein
LEYVASAQKNLPPRSLNARTAFDRMSRFETFVLVLKALRAIGTTIAATAVGLTRALYSMITGDAKSRAALEPGDVAPDFTLAASDGRTYRLADMLGAGIIIVAWFPKAFTGG